MTDIKQLLKEFERYAYGQSLQSAFTELLDWTLLPFKMQTMHRVNNKH
jgi:type I restriction enzyme M protein